MSQTNDTIVLPMFVSESIQITDDILHFCGLFGSAPYCYQVLTNLFEACQNFSGCIESGRFTVGAPTVDQVVYMGTTITTRNALYGYHV